MIGQYPKIGWQRRTMLADEKKEQTPGMIELPAPTVWPMITALSIMLLRAGLVTHVAVSVVGLILALRGAVGWFGESTILCPSGATGGFYRRPCLDWSIIVPTIE